MKYFEIYYIILIGIEKEHIFIDLFLLIIKLSLVIELTKITFEFFN